jgi:hypothetical protein
MRRFASGSYDFDACWRGTCAANGISMPGGAGMRLAVKGQWAYLYRAIDSDGQLVDSLLREHRDLAAAKAFFESARSVVGRKPKQVTTDGHTP